MAEIYSEVAVLIYGPSTASPPCNENQFLLSLETDNYGGETSWEVKNTSNGAIALQGSSYNSDQEYGIHGCLPDGAHTFTITDTWGDGVCCGYGEGAYKVEYNGSLVKSGGQFFKSESVTFG
jgi:hypothetical protein